MSFLGELTERLRAQKSLVESQIKNEEEKGVNTPLMKKTPPPPPPKKYTNKKNSQPSANFEDILKQLECITRELETI